jgi:acyl phosphate:glycerol-3-phosphate acyltransferase
MEILSTVLLALAGFLLGAVPFSVIIGRLFLRKNIQEYGDGNPGAVNVFRAGSVKAGLLAVFLDIVKGIPFVFLAHAWLELPALSVVAVGVCAILGHAFSPFLVWHGGKAVSITFGVLLGLLPVYEPIFTFIAFVVAGFLFVENDSWVVVLGAAASLAFLAVIGEPSWVILLMSFILALYIFKHFDSLRSMPRLHGRFIRWLETKLRGTPV